MSARKMSARKMSARKRRLADVSNLFLSSTETKEARRRGASGRLARVIPITSGKGGTGKTIFACNLAIYLAQKNLKTIIFDADMGLANAHLFLGVAPKFNIYHFLKRERELDEIMTTGPCDVKLVPGGSGIKELVDMKLHEKAEIFRQFTVLEEHADIILIDTGSGISHNTTMFLNAAEEIILVGTPALAALTDAYAIIKTTLAGGADVKIRVVINQVTVPSKVNLIFDRLHAVTKKFLGQDISFWGHLVYSDQIDCNVVQNSPFILSHPNSAWSRCIRNIGDKLITTAKLRSRQDSMAYYFHRLRM